MILYRIGQEFILVFNVFIGNEKKILNIDWVLPPDHIAGKRRELYLCGLDRRFLYWIHPSHTDRPSVGAEVAYFYLKNPQTLLSGFFSQKKTVGMFFLLLIFNWCLRT
jgi:hypothetical protein